MQETWAFSKEQQDRRSYVADRRPIRKAKKDKVCFVPSKTANPTKFYDKKSRDEK